MSVILKDFQDFVEKLLTSENVDLICKDVNVKLANAGSNIDIGSKIAIIALHMSIDILGAYHKWLEDEDI